MSNEVYLDARFNWNGRELVVRRSWYNYGSGRQPAILCFDEHDEECCTQSGIPYGLLTVNLDHPATEYDPDDKVVMQFLDVNNWPGIEEILSDVMWCQPAHAYCQSGFVNYPIWIFSPDIQEVSI